MKNKDGARINFGGFTWERRDSGGDECWDVILPKDSGLTNFCVKNYGGKPNDETGFSGWRVVSGGPFTHVGGWTSRMDAIHGAAPWLMAYYKKQCAEKIVLARRNEKMLEKLVSKWQAKGARA